MTYIISTLFYWFVWYHYNGDFITWLLGYLVLALFLFICWIGQGFRYTL